MAVDSSRRVATWGGIPLKHISLITLTFQNSALILIMHYSRIMPPVNGKRYFTSTAVFLNEVIKLAISLTMALYELSGTLPSTTTASSLLTSLSSAVFTGDSWKLAIPAMLYTLQNTLQYLAVSNLDAATFQVTYQLKILTTALFSVTLLRRSLSARQWASLVLLMTGIAIVQIPPSEEDPLADILALREANGESRYFFPRSMSQLGSAAKHVIAKRSATYQGINEDLAAQQPQLNASLGLIAVIIACILSGLAGVYFEKVLKDTTASTPTSLWVRNVQLSFYSLFPSLFIGVVFKDGADISREGFFAGYNYVVWLAIAFQAAGGVIVALVVNYADNIAKNFATSISIVISCLASFWFFDFQIAPTYIIGTSIVLFATYLYSSPAPGSLKPPPIIIADYEKTTIGGDPSYFDAEKLGKGITSPKVEARTSSRPSTPTVERHTSHMRLSSSERNMLSKRED